MKSIELRRKKTELLGKQRVLVTTAEAAGHATLDAEEQKQFDGFDTEITALDSQIERMEKLEARETEAAASTRVVPADETDEEKRKREEDEERLAQLPESRKALTTPEYRKAWNAFLRSGVKSKELRALSADGGDDGGGYWVAPQQFTDKFIKAIDDDLVVRQLATKDTVVTSASLGAASLDADPADADWTAELATGSEDATMKAGKREFRPHPLAKRIKISRKLLRLSQNTEGLVIGRLRYKFGITLEKAYMSGSGVNQPLGLFTADPDGISTARDVVTTVAADFNASDWMEFTGSIKDGYKKRARILIHRNTRTRMRKLKDNNGQFLWQSSLQVGVPDVFDGVPVISSEYAPNTYTTGKYVAVVGDFSYYWIVDALDLAIQRLEELYAEANQVGFIGRYEGDGQPVLGEAFSRMKLL